MATTLQCSEQTRISCLQLVMPYRLCIQLIAFLCFHLSCAKNFGQTDLPL